MTIAALIIGIVALVLSVVVLILNIRRYYNLKNQIEALNRWIEWRETQNRMED